MRPAIGLIALCVTAPFVSRDAVTGAAEAAQSGADADTVTFVVLGHVRGDQSRELNYLLDELLDEVQGLDPDFAVLTGDMRRGRTVARQDGLLQLGFGSRRFQPAPVGHHVADDRQCDLHAEAEPSVFDGLETVAAWA